MLAFRRTRTGGAGAAVERRCQRPSVRCRGSRRTRAATGGTRRVEGDRPVPQDERKGREGPARRCPRRRRAGSGRQGRARDERGAPRSPGSRRTTQGETKSTRRAGRIVGGYLYTGRGSRMWDVKRTGSPQGQNRAGAARGRPATVPVIGAAGDRLGRRSGRCRGVHARLRPAAAWRRRACAACRSMPGRASAAGVSWSTSGANGAPVPAGAGDDCAEPPPFRGPARRTSSSSAADRRGCSPRSTASPPVSAVTVSSAAAVQTRPRDGGRTRGRPVDPDSNYCFGEGGAGTFSDGKLYTRTGVARPAIRGVLEMLVALGAPPEIPDSRPHVGSNRLPEWWQALRETPCVRRHDSLGARIEASRPCATPDCRTARPAAGATATPAATRRPADASCWRRVTARSTPRDAARPGARGGAEGLRDRRARRASPARAGCAPVRRPARHPRSAGGVLRAGDADRRSRRLQLLHVPRRIRCPGHHRPGARRGERHEPVAPRLAVREWCPRRPARAAATGVPRAAPGGAGRR